MTYRQRRGGWAVLGDGIQRNLLPTRRMHVNVTQGFRILQKFRRRFHHHVILIQRRIHGRHLALPEGVIEGVVDQLWRDAESRRGSAVVLHHRLQPLVLLIGIHVGNARNTPQSLQHSRTIDIQILQIFAFHRELIEGAARPPADPYILRRLQIKSGARLGGQFRPQPGDDGVDRNFPLVERLQIDEHVRRIRRATACEPVYRVDRRVGAHNLHDAAQMPIHRLE